MRLPQPRLLAAGVLVLAGCDGPRASPGAATADASADGDDAAPLGVDAIDVPAPCAAPLAGDAAFGRSLHGEGAFLLDSAGASTPGALDVDAYFPRGRVAGAPVVFAITDQTSPRGVLRFDATLDSTLGVASIRFTAYDTQSIDVSGSLLGPSGGLLVMVQRNFAMFTDAAMLGTALLSVCPSGDVPAPTLTPSDAFAFAPGATLWLSPSVPVDPATLTVFARTDAGPVDVAIVVDGMALRITPHDAYPPNADVTFDLGTPRDVLGRAFAVVALPPALRTSAVLMDPSFATDPTPGAIATGGTTARVIDGVLHVGASGGSLESPFYALIALGDRGTATRLRVQAANPCVAIFASVAVVSSDGQRVDVTPFCPASGGDVVVPLPGTGAVWLSIADTGPRNDASHQSLPSIGDDLAIDALTLE